MNELQAEYFSILTMKQQIEMLRYRYSIAEIMAMNVEVLYYLVKAEIKTKGVKVMNDLAVKIKLEALITEREGMKAENKKWENYENTDPTYTQEDFQELSDRMHNLIHELENKGA